jgi:hypothetical protein
VFLNYSYIPSAYISPDNREHAAVKVILVESPKGPSNEKCLGPTNPLNLNSVNQLIVVMVTCGVLFEVRAEFLNNI